ncbi:hypothetical protein [Sulfurospirillum cavolei]|uniref:hypothetical protein n=1 Tax=Sulfurospirillum cavolei TaxID=366522 RepID=UPI003FA268CF
MQNNFLQYVSLLLIFSFLIACDGSQHSFSRKNDPDFYMSLHTPLALQNRTAFCEAVVIQRLFEQAGFILDASEKTGIMLESNLDANLTCTLSNMPKESYIRLTLYQDRQEFYKLQRNKTGTMNCEDIETLIAKLKKEVFQKK